jgi:tellurite resistance protein
MLFDRFLRPTRPGPDTDPDPEWRSAAAVAPESIVGETATVRRIVARLEALPAEQAHYLAAFAYVMSRAAHADLHVTDEESRLMERFIVEMGGLDGAQAVLVVEMAHLQARIHGATEDFLVTREFARIATDEQKLAVLRCCFAIAAESGSISAEEASVVNQIAREIGVDRPALNAVREEFVERLSAIQQMRRLQGEAGGGG